MRKPLGPASLCLLFSALASCSSSPRVDPSALNPPGALTIERIFEDPNLEGPAPRSLKFSPDGKRVTYLKEKATDFKRLDLWEYNLATQRNALLVDSASFLKGEEKLNAEEKARRERLRISESGIVEYEWSRAGNALAFPLGGAIFYQRLGDSSPRQLTDGKGHDTDVQVSPEGSYVSFVRAGDLYAIPTKGGKEIRLTRDANKTVKSGMAEFIAQEEMDRFTGHWWSKDERLLAFAHVDESPVEVAKRYEINGGGFEVSEERYPRAGTANARVKIGILKVGQSSSPVAKPLWLSFSGIPGIDPLDLYVARVQWLPGNRRLAVELESRNQKKLELVFFDAETGEARPILEETDLRWINLHSDLRFLRKSPAFLWSSERTGFRHLYMVSNDGHTVRQLTQGAWPVRELVGVDEDRKIAYFTASIDSPVEQHLYAVSFDSGEAGAAGKLTRISREEGWHSISMPEEGSARHYLDHFSSPRQPSQVSVHEVSGQLVSFLEENKLDAKHPLAPYFSAFSSPEFGTLPAADGTVLHYRLLKPRGFVEGHTYPMIVDVYGGPTAQTVRKSFGRKRELWEQVMAGRGYAILSVDNRGSSNRGQKFATAIAGRLGDVEVKDQKAGVDFMVARGIADPKRVGVFGWSYGGYMALMMMLKEPDTFRVGVAVAPVSDWSLYDTHYTERYLGTPQGNPDGYKKSNVLEYAGNLRGRLLMLHGMADDNVLFTNSTLVYKAFQDKALLFDMMAYPGGKHGISGKKTQAHVYNTISRYFDEHL